MRCRSAPSIRRGCRFLIEFKQVWERLNDLVWMHRASLWQAVPGRIKPDAHHAQLLGSPNVQGEIIANHPGFERRDPDLFQCGEVGARVRLRYPEFLFYEDAVEKGSPMMALDFATLIGGVAVAEHAQALLI